MKLKTEIEKQKGVRLWFMPGVFLLFFLLLWALSPIGIYPDSGSYISMQNGREPLYPLFLWIFRHIFREGDTLEWLAASGQLDSEKARALIETLPALHVATLVQSVLAAVGCFLLVKAIKRHFALSPWLTAAVGLLALFPFVMTPLASASRMVLNKAILTEGLTFPLFYFFLSFLIRAIYSKGSEKEKKDRKKEKGKEQEEKQAQKKEKEQEKEKGQRKAKEGILCEKNRCYLFAFICCILLVLTRNQMLVAFAVWWAVLAFDLLRSGKKWRLWILPLSILCFLGIRSFTNTIYNQAVYRGYQGVETGSYNLLTTVLYLSRESDGAFLSEEERPLFEEMWKQMEEREINASFAEGGILSHAYHYEDAYDAIGLEIQQPVLFGYAKKMGIPDEKQLSFVVNIASGMVEKLMPHRLSAYMENYIATVASGLTRTISASGTVMGIYSVCAYLMAIISMIYLYRKRKSRSAGLMLLALLLIAANVSATALMIMCLSRYMIYNTALFYIACLLMLVELSHMRYNKQ